MWIRDEAWLRRGAGCGGSVVSGQTGAMSLMCNGHVSFRMLSLSSQEPVPRKSAFTTFVEPCLLPRRPWAGPEPVSVTIPRIFPLNMGRAPPSLWSFGVAEGAVLNSGLWMKIDPSQSKPLPSSSGLKPPVIPSVESLDPGALSFRILLDQALHRLGLLAQAHTCC